MSVYLLAVGVGQAEDEGQVQRVGPRGQRFVQHPVPQARQPLRRGTVSKTRYRVVPPLAVPLGRTS